MLLYFGLAILVLAAALFLLAMTSGTVAERQPEAIVTRLREQVTLTRLVASFGAATNAVPRPWGAKRKKEVGLAMTDDPLDGKL